jgi:hypothetical protein
MDVNARMVFDRFGVWPIGRIGAAFWSVATALTAMPAVLVA